MTCDEKNRLSGPDFSEALYSLIRRTACDLPEDVEQALQPGYSTASDWIREMGFGAGMGLVNIKACADEMHLTSWPHRGTRLEAIIHLKPPGGKTPDESTSDR